MGNWYEIKGGSIYFIDNYGGISKWYLEDCEEVSIKDFEKSCKECIDQTGVMPVNVEQTIELAWAYIQSTRI